MNSGRNQRQPECLGPRRTTRRARGAGEGANLALQSFHFGAEDESLRVANAGDGSEDFVTKAVILAAEVEEGKRAELAGHNWVRRVLTR